MREGKQDTYHPLTILFRKLTVGPATANINAVHPSVPAYSRELEMCYMQVIEDMFPNLTSGAAMHTNTQISTALDALTT